LRESGESLVGAGSVEAVTADKAKKKSKK